MITTVSFIARSIKRYNNIFLPLLWHATSSHLKERSDPWQTTTKSNFAHRGLVTSPKFCHRGGSQETWYFCQVYN